MQEKLCINSYTDVTIKPLKKFYDETLKIDSNQNIFQYKGLNMVHSRLYISNPSMPGTLIQKYFQWMYKNSRILTQKLQLQTQSYFNEYSFFDNAIVFDPRGYAYIFFDYFFLVLLFKYGAHN